MKSKGGSAYASLTFEKAAEMQDLGAFIEYRVLSYIDDGWWAANSLRACPHAFVDCEFRVEVE